MIEMFHRKNDFFLVMNEIDPNPRTTYIVALQAWTLYDDKAHLDILLHCGDVQLHLVRS